MYRLTSSRKVHSIETKNEHWDLEFLPMALTFEFDLYSVKLNQHAKYLS